MDEMTTRPALQEAGNKAFAAPRPDDRKVTAPRDDVLADHDACALAELIGKGAISALEATEAAIARAEAVNCRLNAIVTKTYAYARSRCAQDLSGVFAGVPTVIKDSDAIVGVPCRSGSRATSEKPAGRASDFVTEFETTGVVTIATSTMPEFGHTGTTEALLTGPTANPWNTDYSPGGSSGGATALVAAGVVPIAHANDGGGSIRIPAGACGLVGLKPSRGRSATAKTPGFFPINIFHQGIVSRTVRDSAAYLHAIDIAHRASSRSDTPLPPLDRNMKPTDKSLKIALYIDDFEDVECDSQCATAIHEAGRRCEDLGHEVELISNPFSKQFDDDFWLGCWAFMQFLLKVGGRQKLGDDYHWDRMEPFSKHLAKVFQNRFYDYLFARGRLRRFPDLYEKAMAGFDVFLCPTMASPTPKLGYLGPEIPGGLHLTRLKRMFPFTTVHNVSGAPAISLPMGMDRNGLPIGAMFAARLGQDQLLLELALQLEEAGTFTPPLRQW